MTDQVSKKNVWAFGLVALSGFTLLGVQGFGCGQDSASPAVDPLGSGSFAGAAGAGGSGPSNTKSGPCNEEGKVVDCYVQTGRTGDVMNCLGSTQTCKDGAWTQCGGDSGTLYSVVLPASGQRLMNFGTDAGACNDNPCNPYCFGLDQDDAGVDAPVPGSSTFIQGTISDISSFPTAKRYANAATCTPAFPATDLKVCSYDYCCSSKTNSCVQWINDALATDCAVPNGVEYVAGIGCVDAQGKTHIPICNRGDADTPASGKLGIFGYTANPNTAGTVGVCNNTDTTPPEACIIDLSIVKIEAGKCFDVDVTKGAASLQPGVRCNSSADFSTGNRTTMINPPAVTKIPAALKAFYGADNYVQLAEVEKCNNFSFVFTQTGSCAAYGWQPPEPVSASFTYEAVCPPSSKAQWGLFAYDTIVLNASNVLFMVSTANLQADGGPGTFTTPVQLANPANPLISDPAVCPLTGVPGCPKNLYDVLGYPAAIGDVLKLDMTLTATTDVSWVNFWQLNYNCVPSE